MSELPHNSPSQPDPQPTPEQPVAAESEVEIAEIEVPTDPAGQVADREGFRFLAIGFAIFFILIAVCASIVALVMKNMGI